MKQLAGIAVEYVLARFAWTTMARYERKNNLSCQLNGRLSRSIVNRSNFHQTCPPTNLESRSVNPKKRQMTTTTSEEGQNDDREQRRGRKKEA